MNRLRASLKFSKVFNRSLRVGLCPYREVPVLGSFLIRFTTLNDPKKNNLINIKLALKLILLLFISYCEVLNSQNEVKKWYFGNNAALDFMSGAPVNVLGSQLNHIEGSSSISDAAGNLLFYTDGITVWDRNHSVMPNGTGLMGGVSSAQSALIVKQPGNANIYYVFTTSAWGAGSSNYSIVDMNLNGGMGDVTTKNTVMLANCSEKLAATKHCNGTDIWVVNHENSGNKYHAFLLTATGLNASVQSSIGQNYNSNQDYGGQLKFSPNGTLLCAGITGKKIFELFDFDKTTGIISNQIVLGTNINVAYGVEFSPDNSKVYGFNTDVPGATLTLRQWDLCNTSSASIIASNTIILSHAGMEAGSMQLATDGKIYLARFANMLAVINNPNNIGVACNYNVNGFSVAPNSSADGLPNFVSNYFESVTPLASINTVNATNCQNNGSAVVTILNPCAGAPYTYTWSNSSASLQTTATSDTISNLAPGNYNVIVADASCKKDTLFFTITGLTSVTVSQNIIICNGTNYILPGGDTVNTSGTYTDTIAFGGGCDSIITTVLSVVNAFTFNENDTICSGDMFQLPGGNFVSTPGVYIDTLLTTAGCDSIITTNLAVIPNSIDSISVFICSGQSVTLPDGNIVSTAGLYYDTIASSNGCDSAITTTVVINPSPIAVVSPNVSILPGQTITLNASGGGTYNWYPTSGLNISTGNTVDANPSETIIYCVEVTDSNGCKDTACVTVSIELPCPKENDLALPNAFSPNNDNLNDEYCLQGWVPCVKNFEIKIFDRWGEKVFESKDPNFCWDGKYRNQLMDGQVFVYYLKAEFMHINEIVIKQGNISLIR